METISVIIPIYNQEKYLEKCLGSIAVQTYPYLEVLMIDDGSTDETEEICKRFQSKDDRFKYIRKKNAGVASARNKGLDSVTGDLIGFVDPDDWIEANFYERLMALYHQCNADIVSCGRQEVFTENEKVDLGKEYEVICCDKAQALALLVENQKVKSHLWNRIYRPSVFENLRFEEGRVYEDIWILHQVFVKAEKFVFTEEPLYHYRQHPLSIVRAVTLKKQLDHCYAHQCRHDFLIRSYPNLEKDIIQNYSYEVAGLVDAIVSARWKEVYSRKQEIENAVNLYCKIDGADVSNPKIKKLSKNIYAATVFYKIRKLIKG